MTGNKFWRLVAIIEEACCPRAHPAAPNPAPPPPVAQAAPECRFDRRAGLPLDYKDPARLSRTGRLEAAKARDIAQWEADRAAAALIEEPPHDP